MATILIADDDRETRETIASLLQAEGHQAFSAASASELLGLACERPDFDLVLTDLKMPRTDGLQLLQTIRAKHPRARVIVMSAYSTADAVVTAFRSGAVDYLEKPFDWRELHDSMLRALAGAADARSEATQERAESSERKGRAV